jgi:S1 RNA binding domain protein
LQFIMVEAGSVVEGRVAKLLEYGAIVELPDGNSGLIHISEIADEFVRDVAEYLREGDAVTVKVLGRKDEKRWELSLKQAQATAGAPSARPRRRPVTQQFEKRLSDFMKDSNRRLNELRRNRDRRR